MSGTVPLTIGGGSFNNGGIGTVTIPSSLLFGQSTASGSINGMLQSYLNGLETSFGGTVTYQNTNLAGNDTFYAPATSPGGGRYEQFTNMDSTGASTGTGSYSATVAAGITDLAVQVPGNVTLAGVPTTTNLIFGADSNVDYTVTNPTAGTMYLAGGADSVTLYSSGLANAETIYSAGTDTVNLVGTGTDYVSVYGNAVVKVQDANAYVASEGNATTNLYWDNQNSGGTLHFTNNSTVAATIHIGVFFNAVTGAPETSSTKVTAFGGAGGGYYVGGASGNNSLVGGTGVVTLVGGGSNDFLEAQSSIGTNVMFAGTGNETMVATSTTGSNIFAAGLNYPGLGQPQATGVISTAGSGSQSFLLGNVPSGETIYGSTAANATNNYFMISNETAGGGTYSIYNFVNSQSTILFENGEGGAGASITGIAADSLNNGQVDIGLSDGTTIHLKGLNFEQILGIHTVAGPNGVSGIAG